MPDGSTVLLKDGGDVLAEVAELVGRPPAEIEADTKAFLAQLTTRRFLEPRLKVAGCATCGAFRDIGSWLNLMER